MNGLHDPARMETGFDFGMTDLEEQLAGENGPELKKDIAARLAAKATALAELKAVGLAPAEYEKAERASAGLAAAYDVLIRFPVNKTGGEQ
ncbi:hypothetical protein [Roseibium sp.]|uniref:hypothetical protein n=1 Tax=Roseibium sp. TaxID=1936156 RepID=UPI003265AC8F